MINILWVVFILLSIISQWYIIEEKGRKPNKGLWFTIRCIVGGLFMWAYIADGYMWYWTAAFLVGSFWFPFNFGLSIARKNFDRHLGDDFMDKILLRWFNQTTVFYWSALILVITVGLMIFYGRVPFSEVSYLKL